MPLQLTSEVDKLFFTAEVSGERELFSCDGTAAGTKLVSASIPLARASETLAARQ